ncbi:Methyltransferase domain-containing protein [Cyclobacterium lianum]|uniref:Methyltransferase domain-containing protein n=1 Tax=Cyclobacterium lianum TaxID=388280 RepID=A0A1M7IJF6_9BACT|nr:class I SAM-dependent methyltransferase [Cyclobacterium lianum]SHM40738.1 Methyltransferase domain-containing protein [Cyclobacterium lianum]
MEVNALNKLFGNIDIYLLDQLLKGRFDKEMIILDAGCGEGRNSHYFIQQGYKILGVDKNPAAISMARISAKTLDPTFDTQRFQVAGVEELPFHDGAFNAIISSAVMHFADDSVHFMTMMREQMRVLMHGGLFWLRMCTDGAGCFSVADASPEGKQRLPDGTERFVLTEELTHEFIQEFGLISLEPLKSVLVHGQRAMGAFLFQKGKGNQV